MEAAGIEPAQNFNRRGDPTIARSGEVASLGGYAKISSDDSYVRRSGATANEPTGNPMLRLEQLQPSDHEWKRMDMFQDRVIFQTREWIEFLAAVSGGEPVFAAVKDGSDPVGYFSGLAMRRFGVPMLGSPLPGWSTRYLGFNLRAEVPRRDAVEALMRFAFDDRGSLHVELRDRHLVAEDVRALGLDYTIRPILEVDLRPSEEEILARMTSASRRCVRKAEKVGVTIEEAHDLGFADDYWAQLREVFGRQGLVPPFKLERVKQLIHHVAPTGRLLLLRARDPAGKCIATGIYPAMNRTMYFWGGASSRQDQILRPNEAVMWYAMRYWKARGMDTCDLGGTFPPYKVKYGPLEVPVVSVRASRYRTLSRMRNLVRRGYRARQRISGGLARRRMR